MPRHGENIRKRKDARWEGRYRDYNLDKKKVIYRSVYGKTYAQVKTKLQEAKERRNTQEQKAFCENEQVLFGAIADEWLTEIRKKRKYSTYVKYEKTYVKYIKDKLSKFTLGNIKEDITIIERLFSAKNMGVISDNTIYNIYGIINRIIDFAECEHHITISKLKQNNKKESTGGVEIFNPTEQAKLLSLLMDEPDMMKLGILVCLSTGLRLGEICALKWEDIDFSQSILYVQRTVQRIANPIRQDFEPKTILLEGEPKSVFSNRTIPFPQSLLRLLIQYRQKGIYLLNGDKPMEPRTYQKYLKRCLKNAGVSNKTFHALRHTFATNCINSGTDIKSLSEILGHSDVKITLNRYVHPSIDTKRKHLDTLFLNYGQYWG